MPQLGESIAEATILRLMVAAGDVVHADQEIMDVETQKANMSVTTPCGGTVAELTCECGISYPVGAVLGYLSVSAEEAERTGMPMSDSVPVPPVVTGDEDTRGLHFKVDSSIEMPGQSQTVQPILSGLPVPANATGASYISPRLRVRMQELGLNAADLAAIAGSGGAGRVTVEDFESFMTGLERHKMSPASPMRIAVADSMRRSWTRPLATVGITLNMEPMLAHRRSQLEFKAGPALYALRALAIALSESPALAGRLIGKRIVHPPGVGIGFAVEVEEGVMVPVLQNPDTLRLRDLVAPYNDLVERSRARKLPPEARGPGIATVTNFGTFGIEWATPIPLPEQTLLLGLGAGAVKPVWSPADKAFVPQTQAQLTLSFDHRVLDGGGAGRLLHRIATLLQSPADL